MEKLDPKQKTVWFLEAVLVLFLLWIFFGAWLFLISPLFGFLGVMIFAILVLISYIFAGLYYKCYSYELTDEKIIINKGIIVKKSVSIPYGRIQNVNIIKGPIQRIFGIATLKIETAGASGSYAISEGVIPGILFPEELSEKIISRVIGIKTDKEGLG